MSNASTPSTSATTAPPFNPVNALITSLQTLITTAQAEAGTSAASQAQLQELLAHAQATILLLQLQATGTPPISYVVKPTNLGAEPIFLIAQQQLGDWRRYTDIQTLNGLRFIALDVGQVLLLPAS